jgi:hypothetical protein
MREFEVWSTKLSTKILLWGDLWLIRYSCVWGGSSWRFFLRFSPSYVCLKMDKFKTQ